MPVWPDTNLGAEVRQQRLRYRGHVAVAIDRREMRGTGRRHRFGAERAPAVFIAHVLQPFAIGRLQRRGIGDVGRRIRSAARGLEIVLQQAERARKRWTGGEFWCREHLAAAIGNRQRLTQMRAERLEVFDRQRAAGGLDVGGEVLRQIALVEVARAGAGELRHRGLEPVLGHADFGLDAPLRIRRQPVLQIGRGARGVTPQVRSRTRNHQRGPPVDRKPFAGELDARRQQFLPRQFGVTAVRFLHAGDHAGHGDRAGAMKIAVVLDARPGKNIRCRAVAGQRIILKPQAARRAHAVVDHFITVFARPVEHHRAAAAEPAHPGLQHAQRKRGRDHGVDAVAARGQHLGADMRRPA